MLRFGVDIGAKMLEWWEHDYRHDTLIPRYGTLASVFCVVLGNTVKHDWRNPLSGVALTLVYAYEGLDDLYSPTGLRANVTGQLRFALRTKRASREAVHNPDLVEPGDFPLEGAFRRVGYWVAVAGSGPVDAIQVGKDVVDQWVAVRRAAARAPIDACHNHGVVAHKKYLLSKWVPSTTGPEFVPIEPGQTARPEDGIYAP